MTPAPPSGSAAAAGENSAPGGIQAAAGEEEGAAGEPQEPHHHLAHTWQEARQLAFDCAAPIPAAPVPLRNALRRILAADLEALQDIPHYASSAMDGWAVNGSGPWILAEPGQRLAPHQASPIVTGGLIPPGAKAVLRSESGLISPDEDGLPALKTSGAAKPGEPRNGEHIRKAGEEAAAGELLVKTGTVLNPAHLALAALAGHDTLSVLGKPVVRLVLTGSEVVPAGVPQPGEVRDTFGPQLAGVVEMLGGICSGEAKIGDSYSEWLSALEDQEPADPEAGPAGDAGLENLPADVVITTGGTGRSGTDHLRRAVAELGGRLLIDGIAMRPGHPAVLAELPDGRFIIGLPGNPLAAMMALSTLAGPLLAALGHGTIPPIVEVPCGSTIEPDPGRTRLMPFRLLYGMASPAQHTGPGMMRGLAAADGVLVMPPHGVQLGELVPAFALPWGPPIPEPGAAASTAKTSPKRPVRKPAGAAGPVDWSALFE
ncbi:molybdopterin molybdotransferase [Arthrobacter sp. V4I6]|uniref:molybdopterin molybdotransferase MoeA n=1 Tax=unclassified Arthrobacter TaxID=235627 RepID=UPI00277FE324|nr:MULTISPECIES: molybdopterin molybdotransferase MoeA [unclassified Arthrobacter]MDQ0822624.1 molybdopterin molybdotransferase [Arthrobacter sp. V1I7]MDQ0852252.1 molybdopterin molybdotransferase [Arthrobacter sp. V4I6]